MELTVTEDDSVTLDFLVQESERGSVLRSAHAGNQYVSNLILAHAGIPFELFDWNLQWKDHNYEPAYVAENGYLTRVAGDGVLICKATVHHPHPKYEQYFAESANVARGHLNALKDATNNQRITLVSEAFWEDRHLILTLLDAVHRDNECDSRGLWYRTVTSEGLIAHIPRHTTAPHWELMRGNIFGVTNRESGWVLPNLLAILIDAVRQHRASGSSIVYHLSGPDMVNYISGLIPDLQQYAKSARVVGCNGPVEFRLVPTSGLRFAGTLEKQDAVDDLLAQAIAYRDYEQYVRAEFTRDQAAASKRAREFGARKSEIGARIRQQAANLPELFYVFRNHHRTAQPSLSQYDLLAQGTQLYIPEALRFMPIHEASNLWTLVSRIAGRVRC